MSSEILRPDNVPDGRVSISGLDRMVQKRDGTIVWEEVSTVRAVKLVMNGSGYREPTNGEVANLPALEFDEDPLRVETFSRVRRHRSIQGHKNKAEASLYPWWNPETKKLEVMWSVTPGADPAVLEQLPRPEPF